MAVITISRGSFSGGKTLAECLARNLEYRCVDREVIVERAAARGVSQEELRDALEKAPTFLERFQHKKYLYLTLIQAALVEEVREGKAVYHGHAGHLLLRKGGPILRTRIIAPLDYRLKMCMDRLRLTRQQALDYIEKADNERRRWTHYLYGVDWGEPSLYDVVINLEHLTIRDACEAVSTIIRRQACFQFGPRCREAMDNLALASNVKVALALHPSTAGLEFEADASNREVRLRGRIASAAEYEEVMRIASGVEGVRGVVIENANLLAHA